MGKQLRSIADIPSEKVEAVIRILRNPSVLPERSRNERIAEQISKSLAEPFADWDKTVKELSRMRGRYLHTFYEDRDLHLRFDAKVEEEIDQATQPAIRALKSLSQKP